MKRLINAFYKNRLFYLVTAILILSFSSRAQLNSENTNGGDNGNVKAFSDSVSAEIYERIYNYLEVAGIKGKHQIANFKNKRYHLMVPLKKDEDILIIWANIYFDTIGKFRKKITHISDLEDVDCNILGERICQGIANFKIGYEKKYGLKYEGNISINETPTKPYIEVTRMISGVFGKEEKIKFDFEGNFLSK